MLRALIPNPSPDGEGSPLSLRERARVREHSHFPQNCVTSVIKQPPIIERLLLGDLRVFLYPGSRRLIPIPLLSTICLSQN
jgi:hypothetical protein